ATAGESELCCGFIVEVMKSGSSERPAELQRLVSGLFICQLCVRPSFSRDRTSAIAAARTTSHCTYTDQRWIACMSETDATRIAAPIAAPAFKLAWSKIAIGTLYFVRSAT